MPDIYYWIFGLYEGKPLLDGPHPNELIAEEEGSSKFEGGEFKVYPLPTHDEAKATRMIRAIRWKESNSMGTAMERVSHRIKSGKQDSGLI